MCMVSSRSFQDVVIVVASMYLTGILGHRERLFGVKWVPEQSAFAPLVPSLKYATSTCAFYNFLPP